MSAHTPGPWWATDHGVRDVGGYIAHTNSVQRYLGQEERYAFEVAQREADKRLIAAAPALLEALQGLIREHDAVFAKRDDGAQDSYYNAHPGRAIAYRKARAAIAAATGQAGEQHG